MIHSARLQKKYSDVQSLDLVHIQKFLNFTSQSESSLELDASIFFEADECKAQGIIEKLCSAGILTRDAQGNTDLSPLAKRLQNETFLPEINDGQVQLKLSALLDRADHINSICELTHRIKKIDLFGSCLKQRPDGHGDIDIEVLLEERFSRPSKKQDDRVHIQSLLLNDDPYLSVFLDYGTAKDLGFEVVTIFKG